MYDLQKSKFHIYRAKYSPRIPSIFKKQYLNPVETHAVVPEEIVQLFPNTTQNSANAINFQQGKQREEVVNVMRIGCVLSGGQAPGGHNVIVGVYDYIKNKHKNSQLFGFLDGPSGIYKGKYVELNRKNIDYFRNRGGFDMIRSGRDKIQTPQQFSNSLKHCQSLKLDGLVIIGGDDSNTNAAKLAEYFLKHKSNVKVIGCPKTIDGDLKNQFVQVSFGFDTACKTYAQSIGSLMTDTLSSKKYYHFIRLMGRSASHIALECALLTRPTYAFIGQEVQRDRTTLRMLVEQLTEIIVRRAQQCKNYGVVLIPQGLIEFIPQVNVLIAQINTLLSKVTIMDITQLKNTIILPGLTQSSKKLFEMLPQAISEQLLLDRDPHGNVQVAKIQTEKLIISLIKQQLSSRSDFKGKFAPIANYFGYEGRCAFPTNFDCDYCYSLGFNAGALVQANRTGLMSCIRNLKEQPENWLPGGYPLISMMNIELRKQKKVPVIRKALVQLDGPLFKLYTSQRQLWARNDYFNLIGPTQYTFPIARPYLIQAPKLQDLFLPNSDQQFRENQKPFAVIKTINLNDLTLKLAKQPLQCPQILNHSVQLTRSQELKFSNKELKVAVEKEYQYLSKQGHCMLTMKQLKQSDQINIKKIGVSFNGRQCPGGHNIIKGLLSQDIEVYGFIGGSRGIINQNYITITSNNIKNYTNQSGFHLLGRTVDKLRSEQQLQKTLQICQKLNLDGLLLIGASHTFTDAAILSDYFIKNGCKTVVNCVPTSIDNNIYHSNLQVSVGFSTSSHMYSTLISNLMIDASSNTKYWYFIKLMGRDPSHLTLQCALSTRPNYTIISQEVQHKGWDIDQLVDDIVRLVIKRQEKNLNFGCILIPQGLPMFLPSLVRIKNQLDEINKQQCPNIVDKMSAWARQRYLKLPDFIQKQLLLRDDNTNALAVSQIQTQKLLATLIAMKLKQLKKQDKYKGSFSSVCHFFGYQGRCAIPSNFDRNLSYTYGKIVKILVQKKMTGFCSSIRGLTRQPKDWFPIAIPISHMLQIKQKSSYGINKPIVKSANVNLNSPVFLYFAQQRSKWQLTDHYESPGPIQHFGQMKNYTPISILLMQKFDLDISDAIKQHIEKIQNKSKFGADHRELKIINATLQNLLTTLKFMEQSE